MPVRIASASWRSCCTCARARSLVIQPRLSSGAAIFPSRVRAALRVTSGRPVRMKCTNASFSFSASAVNSPGDFDFEAGRAQLPKAFAAHQRIRILHGRDTRRTPARDERLGTRRCAPLMGARLQIDIQSRASRAVTGLLEGDESRRALPGTGVKTATDDLIVAHQDRADQWVGAGLPAALAGQIQSLARENRDSFLEERFDELFRLEWQQVFRLFADADVADGQIQLARDRHHDPAFGGAIQLGQHDAGDAGDFP